MRFLKNRRGGIRKWHGMQMPRNPCVGAGERVARAANSIGDFMLCHNVGVFPGENTVSYVTVFTQLAEEASSQALTV